jgi:hypothetical protein
MRGLWESDAGTEPIMSDILLTRFLLVILTFLTMLPLFAYRRRNGGDLFEPIYWASAYFFLLFVLRPIYDLTLGSEILGEPPFNKATASAFNLGLLYLVPCFLVFLIGYYSKFGVALSRTLPALRGSWSTRKFLFFAPMVFGVGLLSWFLLIHYQGGFSYYVSHKHETLTGEGISYLMSGISLVSLIYVVSLTRYLIDRKGGFTTFVILFPTVLIIGFLTGSKGHFLIPLLVTLIAVHYLRKRIRVRHILIFVILVFLSFPIFNVYRSINDVSELVDVLEKLGPSVNAELFIRHAMSRYQGIDSLTYVIRDTPDVMSYQLGTTVWPVFIAWVPRQLWPDKPIVSFGKIFGETYFREFFMGTGTAPSVTILGEAYINWHVGGMLWTALFCGVFLRSVYEYLIRRNSTVLSVFVYGAIFPYLFMIWEFDYIWLISIVFITVVSALLLVALMGDCGLSEKTEGNQNYGFGR